jgi:surfactin synthase thioesterase subunit
MIAATAPETKSYFIDLPMSRLHVMEAGSGEPLILIPATISELNDWRNLVQFMAQWFRVYFFELPGHGESSSFQEGFSSHKIAELVSQLADELGYERFNLMGFSFGGLLAMRTFKRLSHRPAGFYRPMPRSSRAPSFTPQTCNDVHIEPGAQSSRRSEKIRGSPP